MNICINPGCRAARSSDCLQCEACLSKFRTRCRERVKRRNESISQLKATIVDLQAKVKELEQRAIKLRSSAACSLP